MGCLVHADILNEDGTLTENAKRAFIRDVKDVVINGTKQSDYPCGDPLPPVDPPIRLEDYPLEDEKAYPSFHKDILRGRFEATAKKMDLDPSYALVPLAADPIAMAGSFGVTIKPVPFPDGFAPYLTGMLPIKFLTDLLKAGVTDFLLPSDLVPELSKLLSVPTPPNLVPDVPISPPPIPSDLASMMPPPPDIPSLEVPSQPAAPSPFDGIFVPPEAEPPPIPSFPTGTIPIVPLSEMQTALERELAVVGAIPNLLMKLISEVPKLLDKILVPTEMIPYICKLVSESGAFPLSNPANSMERAYNAVLSRWFSYFLYLNMIGKTLGSAKGSAVASIARSEPINLFPPEPEEKPEDERPEEPYKRVIRAAEAMGALEGSSFGSNTAFYQKNLFYIEDYLAGLIPYSTTIHGEIPPDPNDRKQPNETRKSIANNPNRRRRLGVPYPEGFRTYAGWIAVSASSCGLFARYCYFAGGAINKYFNSQYPLGSALVALKVIGMFKNYKWLNDDGTVNQNLIDLSKTTGINVGNDSEKINSISAWDYYLDANGQLASKTSDLTPYLKSEEDLAVITPSHLAAMAQQGKPLQIQPGDMVLMVTINADGEEEFSAEHIAVYTSEQTIDVKFDSYKPTGPMLLSPAISGIHGGQPDSLNTSEKPRPGFTYPLLSDLKGNTNKGGNVIDSRYVGKTHTVIDDTDSPTRAVSMTVKAANDTTKFGNDNYQLTPLEFEMPTAILPGAYDVGYVDTTKAKAGYYLGRSRIVYAGSGKVATGAPGRAANPETYRKVTQVFRTKNFLNPRENGGSADEKIAEAVLKIVEAQDTHPLLKSYVDDVLNGDNYEESVSLNVFIGD